MKRGREGWFWKRSYSRGHPKPGRRRFRKRLKGASVGSLRSGLIFFIQMKKIKNVIKSGPGSNLKRLIFFPEFELREMTDWPVACSCTSIKSFAEMASRPDHDASKPSESTSLLAPACCRGWIRSSSGGISSCFTFYILVNLNLAESDHCRISTGKAIYLK